MEVPACEFIYDENSRLRRYIPIPKQGEGRVAY